jgi:predicted transcriptional regulator
VTSKELNVDSSLVSKYIPKKAALKEPPIINHIIPLQEAVDMIEEQLIKMAIDKYKSVKLAAKVLDISQPSMSRIYKKNREKIQHKTLSPSNKRKVLEQNLNKQLQSMAIVLSAAILPEEISELMNHNVSPSNPTYKKVQKKLTKMREQEGIIEWVYIFKVLDNNKMLTIVADIYGEWKTSFAPLMEHNGKVLAIIGFDHSRFFI